MPAQLVQIKMKGIRNNDYIIIYSESKHELTIDIYIKPLEQIYTY